MASSSSSQVPGPQTDMSLYRRMLQGAVNEVSGESTNLFYPWETDAMKDFFGQESQALFHVPSIAVPSFAIPSTTPQPSKTSAQAHVALQDFPMYVSAISAFRNENFLEERARKLEKCYDKWMTLLSHNFDAFAIGASLSKEFQRSTRYEGSRKILSATFGLKSPATLDKRANSMLRYLQWHKKYRGGFGFPISRDEAWQYLSYLESEGAGASAGGAFLEAVRFSHFVLGLRDVTFIFESREVCGLAEQMLANKEPWDPADLLTVNEVKLLRIFVWDECQSVIDRVGAVHFLHAIYSRSRWSDFRHVHEILPDFDDEHVGYLEVTTRWHKTAKNADVKGKLLPIVAPSRGLVEEPWTKAWVALREKLNLPTTGVVDGPLLPAPDLAEVGKWTKRPVVAKEATEWLRRILGLMQPLTPPSASSHSFKSSPLSWCAKFGIPSPDQDILGRHVTMGSKHVYARELIAKPLRQFEFVLEQIRTNIFDPDRTRSGYFVRSGKEPPKERSQDIEVREDSEEPSGDKEIALFTERCEDVKDKEDPEDLVEAPLAEQGASRVEVQEQDESGSSESEESTSMSSSSEDVPRNKVRKIEANTKEQHHYAHVKSGVVHAINTGDNMYDMNKFICGKENSEKYVKVDNRRTAMRITCQRCFKAQHVSAIE
ncbi:METTL21B [Symbiodinium natans]|uniref:METTL21B protein n=1 Tax=Symbiodinium natans TaxID=878477 RepID=A0A812FXN2_9DINO|nr:METTL21B [Symbiodinium natans]